MALDRARDAGVVLRDVETRSPLFAWRRLLGAFRGRLTGAEFKIADCLAERFDHRRAGWARIYRGSIAAACGVTLRTVSRALRRLADLGLIVVQSGKAMWRPDQFFPAFGRTDPAGKPVCDGHTEEPRGQKVPMYRTSVHSRRAAQNVPPDPPPSAQRHISKTVAVPDRSASAPRNMDGVRALLARLGVRGPNLEALSRSPAITDAVIRSEWISVATSPRVRSPVAVFATRLSAIAGVTFRQSKAIGRDVSDLVKRLETLRRLRNAPAPGRVASRIGGVILMDTYEPHRRNTT